MTGRRKKEGRKKDKGCPHCPPAVLLPLQPELETGELQPEIELRILIMT